MMNVNAGIQSLVAAIVLGDSYRSLTLAASSQLSVVSNTFVASVSSDYASIRLQFGNVTVSGSSTFNISANALVNSLLKPIAPSIAVIGWVYGLFSVFTIPLTVTGQSTVAFNSNSISKTVVAPINAQNTFISVINFQFGSGFHYTGNLLTLAGQSVLTLNGNYISNSTNTGLLNNANGFVTVAVQWVVNANGAMYVDGGSLLALDNNWVGNHTTFDTAYAVYWVITQLGNGMAVTSGSTISLQNNSILNTMVGPSNIVVGSRQAYVVYWQIEQYFYLRTATSIGTQSKIIINGNTMINVTALANTNTNLYVVSWYIAFGFYVSEFSSVHVDNNAMINTTSPSSQINVVRVYSYFANIVVDQSTISMASNSLLNSNVKTATVAGWNLGTSNLTMVDTSTFTTSSNLAASSNIAQQLSVAIVEFNLIAFILISENSALLINDNAALSCSPIASWAAIATFQIDQSVNKYNGQVNFTNANIAMSRNTIQSSTVNSLYLCYWNLQWFTVSLTNFTAVTLSDNTAQNTMSGALYVANLAVGQLAITGNSTFYIQRTSISASAQQFSLATARSVAIASGSQFRVTQNAIALTAPFTSVTGLTFGDTTLDGYLLVTGNTMTSTGQVGSFSLVTAWAFASNPSAEVYACNNSVAWESRVFSNPANFIQPSSLANITILCGSAPTDDVSKPDTAVIAGAVAGSVVGVALLVGAVVFFCRRPSGDKESAPLMGLQ